MLDIISIWKRKKSLPSLPEQERIVAKIEELLSQLDEGVKIVSVNKQFLERYRQAVLQETFLTANIKKPIEVMAIM